MLRIQAIAEPRYASCDLVELHPFLTSIYICMNVSSSPQFAVRGTPMETTRKHLQENTAQHWGEAGEKADRRTHLFYKQTS